MAKPQQQEVARSGYSEVTAEDVAVRKAGGPTDEKGRTGPVPEDNLPGHHPSVEQDKPKGRPPRPGSSNKPAPKRSDLQGKRPRDPAPLVPAAATAAAPEPERTKPFGGLPGGTAAAAVLGTATGLVRRVPVVGGVVDKAIGRFLPDQPRP
jgi:hypothetical protein